MITKEMAVALRTGDNLYHVTAKDSRGERTKCRVNGKCQTWKSRPDEFKLPVKYGLKDCFYITLFNAADWDVK